MTREQYIKRLQKVCKDIKEDWAMPNDSHTKVEYNGMYTALDMVMKRFDKFDKNDKSITVEDRLDFIRDDIWDLNDKLTSICIKLNIEEDDNA